MTASSEDIAGLPPEVIWEYQFRLILVGDSTVGKSSLLRRFCDGKFVEVSDPTVGVDFYARLIEVNVNPKTRVKLQLWDTAGQERFRSITTSYYRNSVGVMLVYDISNRQSFENLQEWLLEAQENVIYPHNTTYMVVGHKTDLGEDMREVHREEGERFAFANGMKFIETSAKACTNVEAAFSVMAKEIYSKLEAGDLCIREGWDGIKGGFAMPRETLRLEEPTEKPRICC
ncbi:ras-related protein Rab-39B-like [Lytechinus variegatus]|uniref:ras-related protein Rab-39B-like n=1 Tax=Lytechinus variegatus TaxID=7654 RepID=UPI001BB1D1FA|nr:ras-related protein Rab-39B-like [Lytechinus variegatus]XP_041462998.1 ras-related protein Rab-39B-like [Lytechinus variegatus]XP_054753188.1 ras-related protein Rab-39B-like [Lytechinus pictus]